MNSGPLKANVEAVKVWPGKGGECGKAGAAASLDSSCMRRQSESAVGAEESPRRGPT